MNEQKFQTEFISFQSELASFIFRLFTNKQDTEDLVQDVYVKSVKNLHTFQPQKASLKTWVFTIGLNAAKNKLKQLNRWGENDLTICKEYNTAKPERFQNTINVFHSTPDAVFEMKEHLDYCFTCISKTLDLNQQICLLLKEVYGFKQKEIMDMTELSEGKVKHGIVDARKNMKRIFNNRCSLVNKEGICSQCTELNGIFNPSQNAHIKAKELKLSREEKNQDKLLDLRLALVKNTNPLNAGSTMHTYFAENLEKWVDLAKNEK